MQSDQGLLPRFHFWYGAWRIRHAGKTKGPAKQVFHKINFPNGYPARTARLKRKIQRDVFNNDVFIAQLKDPKETSLNFCGKRLNSL